jgi:RHS repeat-associated protein
VNVSTGAAQTNVYFIHTDHLNTPRLVANSSGTAVWRWDQQEPFGTNAADENPSGLGAFEFPLRFPGQYADKETALYYNIKRDYDPVIARYIQGDPLGLEGGPNVYDYGFSDPLRFVDPSGEWGQLVIAGGIVLAGYGVWKAFTVVTNVVKFQQATAMVASSQTALNAASQACQTYPQGGACFALPSLQQQVYQCQVTQARFGTSILYGDPTGNIPNRPIMPKP